MLSFAIIMLNTSLHNHNVRDKPTAERFVTMNRGINEGRDLPEELLRVSRVPAPPGPALRSLCLALILGCERGQRQRADLNAFLVSPSLRCPVALGADSGPMGGLPGKDRVLPC